MCVCAKINNQSNSVKAVLEIFQFCFRFFTINENISFTDSALSLWLPDCSKLAGKLEKWRWRHNFLKWCHHKVSLTLCCLCCQFQVLVQISCQYHYWLWSYDSFFYKELTRNPEIGNTPAWVLLNIWSLGPVWDIKFDTIVSYKMLLNAAKCQGNNFYGFWVIKGTPAGRKISPPSPSKLGLSFYLSYS